MALAALQPQPESKTTPRSAERCEIGKHGAWHTVVLPLHEQSRVLLQYRVKSHCGIKFLPLAS